MTSPPSIRRHLAFTLYSGLVLLLMFGGLRLALLVYNHELIGATPAGDIAEAFSMACVSTCAPSFTR
jgi:uncharacterized YccA/Bax inhibitor family protein